MLSPDKYYGYADIAQLCEHVITSLFSIAPKHGFGREGVDTPPHSPQPGKDAPPPLAEFIAYVLYRTRLPDAIVHQALVLLGRLKARYPSARGTSTSPHRLFLSSLMLSSKISMDDTYSNKSWQIVGQGMFELREVNCMEREMFAFLGHNIVVPEPELLAFQRDVVRSHQADTAASASSSSSSSSTVVTPPSPITPPSPGASPDERKRKRESAKTSSSHETEPRAHLTDARAASPDRHRRASDAAIALLSGTPSTSTSSSPAPMSSRSYRRRRRQQDVASTASSPPHMDWADSPSSPSTPVSAGPLTPCHTDALVPPPAWAKEHPFQHQHAQHQHAQHHHAHAHPSTAVMDGHVQVAQPTW